MKKAMTVALATAVAAGGFALLGTSASAAVEFPDGKECSKAEYQRIERGMTRAKVGRIVGSPGSPEAGDATSTTYLFGGKDGGAGCFIKVKTSTNKVVDKVDWFPRSV